MCHHDVWPGPTGPMPELALEPPTPSATTDQLMWAGQLVDEVEAEFKYVLTAIDNALHTAREVRKVAGEAPVFTEAFIDGVRRAEQFLRGVRPTAEKARGEAREAVEDQRHEAGAA